MPLNSMEERYTYPYVILYENRFSPGGVRCAGSRSGMKLPNMYSMVMQRKSI